MGINNLEDWIEKFKVFESGIKDEYGSYITMEEMVKIITERKHNEKELNRCEIDGIHCIGHGEGTWDYMLGEFS